MPVPKSNSNSANCQHVYALLKKYELPDAKYMEKVLLERWPDATGFHWSVVDLPLDRVGFKIRISLFAHTPTGKWCFISKRLGDDRPIEFSNNPLPCNRKIDKSEC
jgi:hypothetical protein